MKLRTSKETKEAYKIAQRVHAVLNYLRDRGKHEDAELIQVLWEYALESDGIQEPPAVNTSDIRRHGTG